MKSSSIEKQETALPFPLRRWWVGLGILFLAFVPMAIQQHGISNPTARGAFFDGAFPETTPGGVTNWDVVPAFPNLNFDNPLGLFPEPGSNRLHVIEQAGKIYFFNNDSLTSTKTQFLDLSSTTAVVWDGGMLGLAFHPKFDQDSNYAYVYYCAREENASYPTYYVGPGYPGTFFNVWGRLSRFTVDPVTHVADPNSEMIMINKRLYNGSHRGGSLAFGNDGFLYVTVGEEFRYQTAQVIDTLLEGGVLCLDVDRNPLTSHAPLQTLPLGNADEISGVGYWIPDSNPFNDPTGNTFEEYWTIGHRQPHRLSYDAVEDRFWVGEVGGNTREEINVLESGGNYGWPFREGTVIGPNTAPTNPLGTVKEPALDFLRSEASAIIGGYVYRGSKFPSLYGRYICGDYSTNNLFALDYDDYTEQATKELIGTFNPAQLTSFGVDQANELYMCPLGINTQIYKLAPAAAAANAPDKLSDIGIFTNLTDMTPASGVIPYDLNAPFWSDAAAKFRWLMVPNDGTHSDSAEWIQYTEKGDWKFPVGSVLIKHFEMNMDETDPNNMRKLETRFMVHGTDGKYYGLTYRWDDLQQDAFLQTVAVDDTFTVATASFPREEVWHYPSRAECLVCHNNAVGGVLGPRARQLNGDKLYPSSGVTANQLTTMEFLNMFTPDADTSASGLATMLTSKGKYDNSASLEERARSYLDANCSSCHRPGTGNRGLFDARLNVPLVGQGLIYGELNEDLGLTSGARLIVPGDLQYSVLYQRLKDVHEGIQMPPLAKNVVDTAGVNLIKNWILNMPKDFPVQGTGLQGDYYWGYNHNILEANRVDGEIDFNWGTGEPFPALAGGIYSIKWYGELLPLFSETYTFTAVTDDGVRLIIDGDTVINKWFGQGVNQVWSADVILTAGQKVDIQMDYYQGGGVAIAGLYWESPSQEYEIIPSRVLYPPSTKTYYQTIDFDDAPNGYVNGSTITLNATASSTLPITYEVVEGPATVSGNILTPGATPGQVVVRAKQDGDGTFEAAAPKEQRLYIMPAGVGGGTGLTGTYYDNADLTGSSIQRNEAIIDFYWGSGSPHSSLQSNTFSAEWKGEIQAPFDGTYTFSTSSDDGVRLWINNTLIIDEWGANGSNTYSGNIAMTAGTKVPIKLEYFDENAFAFAKLSWTSGDVSPEVVPSEFLFPDAIIFPIELLSFEAEEEGTQVVLDWVTAKEQNNDRFEIERSANGTDFNSILEVASVGDTEKEQAYRAFDEEPLQGKSFYRLKQVDKDGTFSHSHIVEVYFGQDWAQTFPNPLSEDRQLQVQFFQKRNKELRTTVEIFNMKGEVMHQQTLQVSPGQDLYQVNLQGLARGMYILRLRDKDQQLTQKLVIP
ncbi:MAG: PA14 domain-containing protein [Bacteroidota bacterium]